MGKRKSRAKPAPTKRMDKLDTIFSCPFCNHGSSVECIIDMKHLIGKAACRICEESFSTTITALTEAIDIYSEWIDECERVNTAEDDVVQEEEEEEEVEEEEEEEVEEEDADEKQTTQASGEEGRLYVGNLPYTITSSELSQLFGEAGNVVDVQIVYDKVTDRSRGFGFVTMGTIEEAKEAIQMFNSSQIGGRTVKVNYPEVPRGGEREVMRTKIRDTNQSYVDSPHKIYAGNLGWNLTSQGLKDAFADQPGVLGAKVIYERNTGRSRGFGFISFESAENVQSALPTMNGVEVEGRALRLNLASEREKATVSPPSVEEGETEAASLESSEVLSNVST